MGMVWRAANHRTRGTLRCASEEEISPEYVDRSDG